MSDWRIVIAFSEPPARFRFTRAKSGKTWFRKIEGRQWAIKLGDELKALYIHGVIKRIEDPAITKAERPYRPRVNGMLPVTRAPKTTRTSGYTVGCKNPRYQRRRGRGRRGM